MNVAFSDSALSDLENIKKYYREQGVSEVGENFIVDIFKHIETLTDHPDAGRIVPEFNENHIRELIHSPFRVVYLRGKISIQIIRVWRSERLLNLNEDKT